MSLDSHLRGKDGGKGGGRADRIKGGRDGCIYDCPAKGIYPHLLFRPSFVTLPIESCAAGYLTALGRRFSC